MISYVLSLHVCRYKAIVKYKTAYYSFYLPVALAMHMVSSHIMAVLLRSMYACKFIPVSNILYCYTETVVLTCSLQCRSMQVAFWQSETLYLHCCSRVNELYKQSYTLLMPMVYGMCAICDWICEKGP